jgi:hypothetical protein
MFDAPPAGHRSPPGALTESPMIFDLRAPRDGLSPRDLQPDSTDPMTNVRDATQQPSRDIASVDNPSGAAMPSCEVGPTATQLPARSLLLQSLIRLRDAFDHARREGSRAEDQFQVWQERWSDRREQIARRLELIDGQLEALVRRRDERPRLTVVGVDDPNSSATTDVSSA